MHRTATFKWAVTKNNYSKKILEKLDTFVVQSNKHSCFSIWRGFLRNPLRKSWPMELNGWLSIISPHLLIQLVLKWLRRAKSLSFEIKNNYLKMEKMYKNMVHRRNLMLEIDWARKSVLIDVKIIKLRFLSKYTWSYYLSLEEVTIKMKKYKRDY